VPDPVRLLASAGVAAAVAALLLLLCGRAARAGLGWALGVGAGFLAGARVLLGWRYWSPAEDQGRLLALVVPAAVGWEVVASFREVPRWLAWCGRLAVAAAAAPVLLYHTVYLVDLTGPGSRKWTPAQAGLILGGLAAALLAVWGLLARLSQRSPGRSLPVALALVSGGAGITVMLSGYSTAGQLSVPLAGALVGAVAGSLLLRGPAQPAGAVGVGLVGLFGILVVGRFLASLPSSSGLVLLAAPLVGWLPELPYVRRLGPALRGMARVLLVAVPVALGAALALQKPDEVSKATPGPREPSVQDYMDFGK
jgi:hypothetical protein